MFIAEICKLFKTRDIPFAIVGGYAVALHGVVRGTFDVDIVTEISEKNFVKIEEAVTFLGLKPRLPVSARDLFANLEEYKKSRNLVAWNFNNPLRMRESLDIIVTDDIKQMEIVEVSSDFGNIPVLSIDSLIHMKSRANREQDQKDIAALKALQAKQP